MPVLFVLGCMYICHRVLNKLLLACWHEPWSTVGPLACTHVAQRSCSVGQALFVDSTKHGQYHAWLCVWARWLLMHTQTLCCCIWCGIFLAPQR